MKCLVRTVNTSTLVKRTLKKRLTEHKAAVKKGDENNGIAMHAWKKDHRLNWKRATVKTKAKQYWKRRILEALHIHREQSLMNVDCGLQINETWKSVITPKQ